MRCRFIQILALMLIITAAFTSPAQALPGDETVLVRAWGVLKYHHPRVTQCELDWDTALLNALETLAVSTAPQPLPAVLQQLLDSANGDTPVTPDAATTPAWLDDPRIPESVAATLATLLAGDTPQQCYVARDPLSGNVEFGQDNAFSGPLDGQQARHLRVLAAARFWNAVEYFYPYKNNLDDDWAATLDFYLPTIADADDNLSYVNAMRRFTAEIQDSQGELHNSRFDLQVGTAPPPFSVRPVDGRFIVDATLPQAEPVAPGDEVISVDGTTVEALRERFNGLAYGANPVSRERVLSRYILNALPTSGQTRVSYGLRRPDGSEYRAELPLSHVFGQQLGAGNQQPWRVETVASSCTFGVLELHRLAPNQLAQAFTDVRDSDGLIVDLRGPVNLDVTALVDLLYGEARPLAEVISADLSRPGTFTTAVNQLQPQRHVDYAGRVIVLQNERSLDRAEYVALTLQAYDNVTVIGSQSAGTIGATSQLQLPGEIEVVLTSSGVRHPDGRTTHRFGIVPDQAVFPSFSALAAGRDPLLESALNCDLLQNPPTRDVQAGVYWNPQRSGEGLEVYPLPSGQVALLQYAFDHQGHPEWLLGAAPQTAGSTTPTLGRGKNNFADNTLTVEPAGDVLLDFKRGPYDPLCATADQRSVSDRASFYWDLDGSSDAVCLEALFNSHLAVGFSGAWSPMAEGYWGLSIYELQGQLVVALFIYDINGDPRWLLGSIEHPGNLGQVTIPVRRFSGYCRDCEPEPLTSTAAGTVTLTLTNPAQDFAAGNTVSIQVESNPTPAIRWNIDNMPIRLLSPPR